MFQGLDVINGVAQMCGLRNGEETEGAVIMEGSFSSVCCVAERGRGLLCINAEARASTRPGDRPGLPAGSFLFFFFFPEGSSLSVSELAGCLPEGPFEEDCQYFSMICVSNRDPKDSE